MKLVEINWEPTDRQLRQFGAISLIAFPLVAWFWGGSQATVISLAGVGLALVIAGMVVPRAVKPLFLAATLIAAPLGMLIGELAMFFIYFCVFLPIGLFFRAAGRDTLQLKPDRKAITYWRPKKQAESASKYYRQS